MRELAQGSLTSRIGIHDYVLFPPPPLKRRVSYLASKWDINRGLRIFSKKVPPLVAFQEKGKEQGLRGLVDYRE